MHAPLEPLPDTHFLNVVTSTSSKTNEDPFQQFYDEAKHLSRKFADHNLFLHPHAGLVSVFHAKVAATRAHLKWDWRSGMEEQNTGAFVAGGLAGFRKNWRVFSQRMLSRLNWYGITLLLN
jgi:hypothetical protein